MKPRSSTGPRQHSQAQPLTDSWGAGQSVQEHMAPLELRAAVTEANQGKLALSMTGRRNLLSPHEGYPSLLEPVNAQLYQGQVPIKGYSRKCRICACTWSSQTWCSCWYSIADTLCEQRFSTACNTRNSLLRVSSTSLQLAVGATWLHSPASQASPSTGLCPRRAVGSAGARDTLG